MYLWSPVYMTSWSQHEVFGEINYHVWSHGKMSTTDLFILFLFVKYLNRIIISDFSVLTIGPAIN